MSLDPSTLFNAPPSARNGSASTTTPAKASKQPAGAGAAAAATAAPRVDLEPLYMALKTSIAEYWAEYKEAVALFVLGKLNLSELALRTDHFLSGDPRIEHLHNHLMVGLLANMGREVPDVSVAPWVSANDKPTAGLSKTMAGNEAERRLKTEVMALPARERRRLKDIAEPDVRNAVPREVMSYRSARRLQPPTDIPPASAGGLNRTNWELEIRKRYNQPLAAETGEFPDTDAVQARMVPICYEEALPNGCASVCAPFLATATEFFVKEVLSSFYHKARLNMSGGSVHSTLTHRFKKQLQWEEDTAGNGDIERVGGPGGLLPVEAREAAARKPLAVSDIKLALRTGDSGIGLFPGIQATVYQTRLEGEYEEFLDAERDILARTRELEEREARRRKLVESLADKDVVMNGDGAPPPQANGHDDSGGSSSAAAGRTDENGGGDDDDANGVLRNGYVFRVADDDDLGWEGGSKNDRMALHSVLDEVLNF